MKMRQKKGKKEPTYNLESYWSSSYTAFHLQSSFFQGVKQNDE